MDQTETRRIDSISNIWHRDQTIQSRIDISGANHSDFTLQRGGYNSDCQWHLPVERGFRNIDDIYSITKGSGGDVTRGNQ